MGNQLYFGDNLDVLRNNISDESVDLVYLDPPFNSKANYNVLFKEVKGTPSAAQIEAFTDFWHWDDAAVRTYHELLLSENAPVKLKNLLRGFEEFLGPNDMLAYLVMMAPRLVELRRVLKSTGSIYLHCDPTASHYLKLLLDAIFGKKNFLNEIVWQRTYAHGSSKKYGPVHDLILFYSKNNDYLWTNPTTPHSSSYIEKHFKHKDDDGRLFQPISLTGAGVRHGESGKPWRGIDPTERNRHWALPGSTVEELGIECESLQDKLDALDAAGMIFWPQKDNGTPRLKWFADKLNGQALLDIWTDVNPISSHAKEKLGYPTQKPQALLERILKASSNEGDVVLDPFCGCGTTIAAAQALNRRWIGVDITYLAINLIKNRLADHFGDELEYELHGSPKDWESARELAVATDKPRKEFEIWALSLVKAQPDGDPSRKGGGDKGIDGVRFFLDKVEGKTGKVKTTSQKIIVQVKSDQKPKPSYVRDLRGVVDREKAVIGALILLHRPGKRSEIYKEAASAGFYHSELYQRDYRKIQVLCIEDLLEGTVRLEFPEAAVIDTSAIAPRINNDPDKQLDIN
jgi:site-specific DNA-methyltransferase (adenine-specific)